MNTARVTLVKKLDQNDEEATLLYPKTLADSVLMSDGETVQQKIDELFELLQDIETSEY